MDNYTKIFSGNAMVGKQIESALEERNIKAIVKDESESARLGGFASSMLSDVDIYVHKDEVEKANEVVSLF